VRQRIKCGIENQDADNHFFKKKNEDRIKLIKNISYEEVFTLKAHLNPSYILEEPGEKIDTFKLVTIVVNLIKIQLKAEKMAHSERIREERVKFNIE
jgi:hypothetical protein